jgi:hypothetical protein
MAPSNCGAESVGGDVLVVEKLDMAKEVARVASGGSSRIYFPST